MSEQPVALPPHVPPDPIYDFDFYHPADAQADVHHAWRHLDEGRAWNHAADGLRHGRYGAEALGVLAGPLRPGGFGPVSPRHLQKT